jgi:hypothetical protein
MRLPHLQVSYCHSLSPFGTVGQASSFTGRIRKVKCDEARPACRRCISAGQVCDGYGVWGGGGNFYGNRQASVPVVSQPPRDISIFGGTPEETRYLEWFKFRTVKKIPGAFVLPFWNTLVFQASANDPAVLNAVLTMSSVHKWDGLNYNTQIQSAHNPEDREQFILQHYIKAIRHLEPHFSSKDRTSIRIALITCVVFICLEFLRGNFQTAQTHLDNGLKVLRELQTPSNLDLGKLLSHTSGNPNDSLIFSIFSRLHVQVELFRQSYLHPCLVLQVSDPEVSTTKFYSLNEAWQPIERLLNRIFHLTEKARQQICADLSTESKSALLEDQGRIQGELLSWLDTYRISKDLLQTLEPSGRACILLHVYHTMASIMAGTCLLRNDESMFDLYTERFISIIHQSGKLWRIGESIPRECSMGTYHMDMSRSLVDIGWIPPLYYTALKCRIHRVRIQAIRLLETASHREGIWDSKIAACVARRVMKIEEGDFYKEFDVFDDFSLDSSPELRKSSLPNLPQSCRMYEVKAILSDGPADTVLLYYRKQTSREWKQTRVSMRSHGR